MTTTPTNAPWHNDLTLCGVPYPTRHPAPDHGPDSDAYLGELPDDVRHYLRAIHEAGHAVAGLAAGAHIHYAKITPTEELTAAEPTTSHVPGGDVLGCNLTDGRDLAVFLGAGERAEDRWIRQNNLWTTTRAVGIELGAYSDRRKFLAVNPHFGFGTDPHDYRAVHDLADRLVITRWEAITDVADVLATQLHLTGDQVSDLAKMQNGTHSDTCTGTPAA